jgi:AsmA protein
MGKLIKLVVWLLWALVLMVLAVVIILPIVFDPNDYKDQIVERAEEYTGRTLQIDGDLELSLFPWLAVDVGQFTLGNAEGFGEQPFATAKSAAIRVKLMPLLQEKLEVDTISLDGLVLNLARAKDGRTNMEGLTGSGDGAAKPRSDGGGGAAATKEEGVNILAIGGVNISNGQLVWDDRQSGQKFEIDQLNLKSGTIVPGSPVGLELGMLLKSHAHNLEAGVDLDGTVELNEEATTLKIGGLKLELDATGDAIPLGALKAKLEAAIAVALDGSSISISGLKLSSGDLRLSGDIDGQNLAATPTFSGAIKLASFNLRRWMLSQGMKVPDTADSKALTKFSAELSMQAVGESTKLNTVALVLDDTKINGSANLTGGVVGFAMEADAIDLDRYLAPENEGSTATAANGSGGAGAGAAAGSADSSEGLFPVEVIRDLNLNGTITIGRLTVNKLLAENVKVTVRASNGRLNLNQDVSQFYEGSYQGAIALNVNGATPSLRIQSNLSDIQAGPLLKQLTDRERLTGKGRFRAKLNASGNSVEGIKRTLGGNVDFRFEDGAVKGINLAQIIRDGKALLGGKGVAKSDEPLQTDFTELGGSGVIENGVLTNDDLLARSPYMRVNGAGTVNLVSEELDYDLNTTIVNSAAGQGGEELAELEGKLIPIHFTGPYSDPEYSIDWAQVAFGRKEEELKEELKEKLLDELLGKEKEETAASEAAAGTDAATTTPKDTASADTATTAPQDAVAKDSATPDKDAAAAPEEASAEDKLKQKLKEKERKLNEKLKKLKL